MEQHLRSHEDYEVLVNIVLILSTIQFFFLKNNYDVPIANIKSVYKYFCPVSDKFNVFSLKIFLLIIFMKSAGLEN